MVRPLRVVPQGHLLSRGPSGQLRLDLAPSRLALGATADRHGVCRSGHASDLAPWVFITCDVTLHLLLLLLDIVVVACITVELGATGATVLVEALTARAVSRVCLVDGQGVHLRVLGALVPVAERVLLVRLIRLAILLSQIQLAVHVKVVHLLQRHPSVLSPLLVGLIVI